MSSEGTVVAALVILLFTAFEYYEMGHEVSAILRLCAQPIDDCNRRLHALFVLMFVICNCLVHTAAPS